MKLNFATLGATLSAIAGAVGAVFIAINEPTLGQYVTSVLEAVAGILVLIPSYHVSSVAKSKALAR